MYSLYCMSTDCDTAYCTAVLRNTCLTCHTAWGCAVIILLRNMCYTVNGLAWCVHTVLPMLRNTQWTRDAGTQIAPPRAVHGQGRSNQT